MMRTAHLLSVPESSEPAGPATLPSHPRPRWQIHIIVGLMRGVPDPVLRRDYRRRLWTVIRRRPRLRLLRVYVVRCALHYHFDRLIAQMRAERGELPPEIDSGPNLTSAAAGGEVAA